MPSSLKPVERGTGADEGFAAVYQRQHAALYGLVYRLLGDHGETEDVLQEAFLELAGAAVLQRPDDEVAAWLRRVGCNLAVNRLRTTRRARERLERVGRLEPVDAAADADAPPALALQREQQWQVRRTLARLPERQRLCLLLRHSGYSYAEIAATLDVAIGSVGVLLARAERAFREAYGEEEL